MILIAFFALLVLSEDRPQLSWQLCTASGCTDQKGFVTIDVNWRWRESTSVPWPDEDYPGKLGVSSNGSSLKQNFVTESTYATVVGSRLYLLDADQKNYVTFSFINKEFTYTVDLSNVPCGINAAFYTVELKAEGGTEKAEFGGGYCDGNYVGDVGCAEFDIMEGNSKANVFTTHACKQLGQFTTTGQCDSDGCGLNVYAYGEKNFWGTGSDYSVDTSKPFTVVTQFISTDGTDNGDLAEVRRLYVQGGKVIQTPKIAAGNGNFDSISDAYCNAAGHSINSGNSLAQLGASFKKGHVLTWALWDSDSGMAWLDGGNNGPCGSANEDKTYLESTYASSNVVWSNHKYGDIDSTY